MKGDPIKLVASKLIFGVPLRVKRFVDLPPGAQIRLRLRADNIAQVFVRSASGVRHHYIEDHGKFWKLGPIIGRNQRIAARENLKSLNPTS